MNTEQCVKSKSVEGMWEELSELRRGGVNIFTKLTQIARLVLCIPHSNAAEERLFSQTKKNLIPERSLLDFGSTLNSMMVLKNNPGLEPCDRFEPTKEQLKMAKSATRKYNENH